MHNDNVVHLKETLLDSEVRLTKPLSEGSDLVPAPSVVSNNKDTTSSPNMQGEDTKFSISELSVPFGTTEAGEIAKQMRADGALPSEIYARTGWWWDAKGRLWLKNRHLVAIDNIRKKYKMYRYCAPRLTGETAPFTALSPCCRRGAFVARTCGRDSAPQRGSRGSWRLAPYRGVPALSACLSLSP